MLVGPRRRTVFGGFFVIFGAALLTPLLPYAGQTALAEALDTTAPEITELSVTNVDRWGDLNLWEDDHFKTSNKLIVGGTIKLGARFSDDQQLSTAAIKVAGEGEEKTFNEDEMTRSGTNPSTVTATWDTGARNGNYTVTFIARDGGLALGVVPNETTRTIDLIVDNTDPSATISGLQDSGNNEEYFKEDLTVRTTLEDTNGISRVWLAVRKVGSDTVQEVKDVSWPDKNWSTTFDTSLYTDGTYDLLLKAWDIAGNLSDTSSKQIILNNFAPSVPTEGDLKSGSTVNGRGTVLDWTDGEDGNGGVTYDFEWSTTSDMSGIVAVETRNGFAGSQTPLPADQPDGTYFWHVRACDTFGACSAWSDTWSITIDTVGPKLAVDTPRRNGDGTYTLFGTTDGDDTIFIYLDDETVPASVNPANGTWSYTTDVPLILGDHMFLLRSYDGVGNEGTGEVAFTVTIEPKIEVLDDPPQALSAVSASPAAVVAATTPASDILEKAVEANSEVLGTHTGETGDIAPVEATPRGWVLLGIDWYWWALGAAGVGIAAWRLIARRGATADL